MALAAVLAAAGCGSDDEGPGIPRDSAAALQAQLDSIQDRFEFGGAACADITGGDDPNTTAVQRSLDALPRDTDAEIRSALEEGFVRLFELVEEQCEEPETGTTETTPPAITETEPPPTETEPPPTETEPPPTETEPPPVDTETAPAPGEGGDSPSGEGGSGSSGQGGDASGGEGGSAEGVPGGTGGGAIVPGEDG